MSDGLSEHGEFEYHYDMDDGWRHPAGFDLNRINRDFKGAKTRRR
jgi:hypothetical protein